MVRTHTSGNPGSCRRRAGGFSQPMESSRIPHQELNPFLASQGPSSPQLSNQGWFLMQTAEESSFLCLGTMCDNPGSVN